MGPSCPPSETVLSHKGSRNIHRILWFHNVSKHFMNNMEISHIQFTQLGLEESFSKPLSNRHLKLAIHSSVGSSCHSCLHCKWPCQHYHPLCDIHHWWAVTHSWLYQEAAPHQPWEHNFDAKIWCLSLSLRSGALAKPELRGLGDCQGPPACSNFAALLSILPLVAILRGTCYY